HLRRRRRGLLPRGRPLPRAGQLQAGYKAGARPRAVLQRRGPYLPAGVSVPGGALRRVRLPWALLLAAVAAPACIKAPVRADLPTADPSAASAPAASASATPQTPSEIVIGRFKADGLAVR